MEQRKRENGEKIETDNWSKERERMEQRKRENGEKKEKDNCRDDLIERGESRLCLRKRKKQDSSY